MTEAHLTMVELLAARAGDATPAVRHHLNGCAVCTAEADALAQRIAALRALPARRPPRDRWPVVRERVRVARRRRLIRRGGVGLAAAAAFTLAAVGVHSLRQGSVTATPDSQVAAAPAQAPGVEVASLIQQSQSLEHQLRQYDPDGRVVNARTAGVIADLEGRIATVDAGISQASAAPRTPSADQQLVNLWRDRVNLMDALVNVHVTRASYVGF